MDTNDKEILEWYARINLNRLGDALNTLDECYEPEEANLSFRISSRLQQLADLGFGLWVKWEYKAFPSEEGFIWGFGRNPDGCLVKQMGEDMVIGVRYEYIKQVALKLPPSSVTK